MNCSRRRRNGRGAEDSGGEEGNCKGFRSTLFPSFTPDPTGYTQGASTQLFHTLERSGTLGRSHSVDLVRREGSLS